MSEDDSNDFSLNISLDETAFAKTMTYLRQTWSYLEIRVEHEAFIFQENATVIQPQPLVEDPSQYEFVYPIFDHGDRLLTSKELASGSCMMKMYYTIDKMVNILYEKYVSAGGRDGGIDEFKIYLDGETLSIRKAFEVIINIPDNWLVMNFEPGNWGSNYLNTLQKLYDKGYNYPEAAPRDYYRHTPKASINPKRSKNK